MQQQLGRTDDGPPADDPTFDRRRGPRRVDEDAPPLDRREEERRALPGIERLLEDVEREAAPGERDASVPAIPFDRRQGPRRETRADDTVPTERRGPDRRRRKPGLPALFGAILGLRPGAAPDEG
jgi:hypothetical protein